MALIEIEIGVFYDTDLNWIEQSGECVDLGEQIVKNALINSTYESSSTFDTIETGITRYRTLIIIYNSVSLSPKNFNFQLVKDYVFNPGDSNWNTLGKRSYMAMNKIEDVTVSEII